MNTKNLSIIFCYLLGLLSGLQATAQTTLPYFTGFDNANQKAGWQMFRKGNSNSTYQWGFSTVEAYSPAECLYHDYPVGQSTLVTDDWYVSPPFTFAANGKIDSIRYSFRGFGMPGAGDTIAIYLLQGNADPAFATSKKLLYDYRGDKYINSPLWNLTPAIALPPTTGTCYIAIRYRTIVNWLDVRFDNIRISGTGPTGIGDKKLSANDFVSLYPNPAVNTINIKTSEPMVENIIYDINGKQVYRGNFKSEINVSNLADGIYILRCLSKNGNVSRAQFVKQ